MCRATSDVEGYPFAPQHYGAIYGAWGSTTGVRLPIQCATSLFRCMSQTSARPSDTELLIRCQVS